MPTKQQVLHSFENNYNLAVKNAKKSGIEFFGSPPDFFKAQEYETILLKHVRSDSKVEALTPEKQQEFNQYINFTLKELLRKHSSVALLIASAKSKKNEYSNIIQQAEKNMLSLQTDLTHIKELNEKFNQISHPTNKPALIELSLTDYQQIYRFHDKMSTVETSVFYSQRAHKDRHENTTKTGIKKSYYKPYQVSRSVKWSMIELVPEVILSFISGVATLLIAGTFSWPALFGGMAIGFALGIPVTIGLHTAVHEYQNSFRREFGKSLGDEIKNDLCEKIFNKNKDLNLKQKKQIEAKVIDITREVIGELYDQIGTAIIEDFVFYYLLSPTRVVSDSFAKKDKKIELDKIKKAPLHIISNIVSERILERIPFNQHIRDNTVNTIELSSELKDSVASNIRSALADFKAAERKLTPLRKEIQKELSQPTPHYWSKWIRTNSQHMQSFTEQATSEKGKPTISHGIH